MKFEIAEEIKNCAADCTKALNCLVDDEHALCSVERCVEGEVHFVKCLDENECNYRTSLGDGLFYICKCPVRKEIYNKYQI